MPEVNRDDIPLVPPDLAILFPLSLFRCKSQSRELEDWERGYWKVNLSSWPETEKVDFWDRMRKPISRGRFGWVYILFDVFPSRTCLIRVDARGGRFECLLLWRSSKTRLGIIICHVNEAYKVRVTVYRFQRRCNYRRDSITIERYQ